jgi:hypothetical protein
MTMSRGAKVIPFLILTVTLLVLMRFVRRESQVQPMPEMPPPSLPPSLSPAASSAPPMPHAQSPDADVNQRIFRRPDVIGDDIAVALDANGRRVPVVVMPLALTSVSPDQQRRDKPPWHVAGGTWTYVQTAELVFGFTAESAKMPDLPAYERGKAVLILRDRASAVAFVAAVGRYLRTPLPAMPHEPRPLEMNAGVFGRNLVHNDDGTFTPGRGGTWTCMKLTIEHQKPDVYAELYFNFDPVTQRAELSEKEPEFRPDVMAAFGWAAGA